MDKMLFTGNEDGLYNLLKDELGKEYEIIECEFANQSLRRAIRLYRPTTIVCVKSENSNALFFSETREDFPGVGIIVVCEPGDNTMNACVSDGLVVLHRPVNTSKIKEAISQIKTEVKVEAPRKKILAVDDNGLVLRNIKEMLQNKYEVSVASSGYKALEVMRSKNFDLVLLDYEMPQMNGYQTFLEMKKEEELKDIPVVFLTAVADQNKIVDVAKMKPAGYLLKPIDAELLFQRLGGILG